MFVITDKKYTVYKLTPTDNGSMHMYAFTSTYCNSCRSVALEPFHFNIRLIQLT